jgi:hypothetical protein
MQVSFSNNSSGNADVPSVPEGMTLPADTLKDLKNVASLVAQDDRMKKQLVSISRSAFIYITIRS